MSEKNILQHINDKKRLHIAACKARFSQHTLQERIASMPPARNFYQAIADKTAKQQIALIAEVKRASPSKGIIREDFNPATLAQSYEKAGASCISVLTDIPYFQGKDEDLMEVRRHTHLPILRKDFMLDPYQVFEARAIGADAILLIMAALSLSQAKELEQAAIALGLSVLVEVHNREELQQALQLQTRLMGINNRDLKTLTVDLSVTESLIPFIPASHQIICESGIAHHRDIQHMNHRGVWAFLVGESLMRQADVEAATRTLLNG